MEVKRKGIKPSNWTLDMECPYCKALLSISVKDISIRTEPKRNFFGTKKCVTLFKVKCKECKHLIVLDKDELPEPITDYLYDHRDPDDFLFDFFKCYFS